MTVTPHKRTAWALALAVFLVHGAFAGGWGWNQSARLGAIFSFVEPGPHSRTFRIDPYVISDSPRGLFSGDWAQVGDHYYPNKAPGTTLLGVPVYAALYALESTAGATPQSPFWTAVNAYLLNIALGVIPLALGSALFFLLLLELGLLPADALFSAALLAFATILFPFDTSLFGHGTTAALLLPALYLLLRSSPKNTVLAGLLASAAVATEYLSVISLALFLLYLASDRRRWPLLPYFLLGAILPLASLFAYQWEVFGSPFASAVGRGNPIFKTEHSNSIVGTLEDFSPQKLWKLLFSPARGIFIYCPALLFCFAGGRHLRARNPALWALSLASIILPLLALSFFNGWHGGWSSGPRYLVPFMPFFCLMLPELSQLAWLPRAIYLVLSAASLLVMWLVAFTGTMAPSNIPNPFPDLFLPRLLGREPLDAPHFLLFQEHFWLPRIASLALLLGAVAWLVVHDRSPRSHQ